MRTKNISRAIPVAALALALFLLPSCSTNTQGDDPSPVYLTVDFTLLPPNKSVSSGTPLQIQTVTLKNVMKNPAATASSFLDVRIDDYVVVWKRVDGGTKAPATEVFPGNVLVPVGGTSTLSNYIFMSASTLLLAPLDQLLPFNGGIDRETGRSEIRCGGTVTFRGHTLSGQTAQGSGTFGMIFTP